MQLLHVMDKAIRDFHTVKPTSDLGRAQLMLQDHIANYQAAIDLYSYTISNGQDILAKAANTSAVSVSREEIKQFLDQTQSKKEEWMSLWEHHKNKLDESVKLCEFERDISRVSSYYIFPIQLRYWAVYKS